MSAPRLRPVVTPILGVVAAALCAATALICAGAALADSKPPPPETTSHTGTLVIVGCTNSDDRLVELAREIRLRRALESLLRRLLSYWRTHEKRKPRDAGHSVDTDDCRLHK